MIVTELKIDLPAGKLLLRSPEETDAEMLIDYLRTVNAESRFLSKEPEEITFSAEGEAAFIRANREAEHEVMLLGFLNGEYVGNCSLSGFGTMRSRHRAVLGIALYQKYTGLGIGRAMIGQLMTIAREWGLEQIELEVVADNKRAIRLYEQMGFVRSGTLTRNMKYKDGTYADAYWMVKQL